MLAGEAIRRLEGEDLQKLFLEIVVNDFDSDVKIAALDKLDPDRFQDFFAYVAMACRSSIVRHFAMKKITDMETLIKLIESCGINLRENSDISRYECAELLTSIYRKHKDEAIREMIRVYEGTPLRKVPHCGDRPIREDMRTMTYGDVQMWSIFHSFFPREKILDDLIYHPSIKNYVYFTLTEDEISG